MKFSIKSPVAVLLASAGLATMSAPSFAQQRQSPSAQTDRASDKASDRAPDKPITEQDVGAKDVALTPLSDLNIKKGEIPEILLAAQDDPYDLTGLARCPQIAAEVGELNAVLGDDIDGAQAGRRGVSAGRAAQAALGSFIPFRGLIREVSGANAQDRKIQAAIVAGSARRGFLKGVGQQRGCRYPARSATAAVIAQADADARAAANAKNQPKAQSTRNGRGQARTVSRPVVQKTR
jgi:hypothetical protein